MDSKEGVEESIAALASEWGWRVSPSNRWVDLGWLSRLWYSCIAERERK
jgi:electron transfer flavoprotein alpha subunit